MTAIRQRTRGTTGQALVMALGLALLPACGQAQSPDAAGLEATTPVVGGPCEGCEAVFQGLPDPASLGSTVRIAPADEPGEPMRLEGTVVDAEGTPAAGVIIYAYHTDAAGVYPEAPGLTGHAARHGRLRAWARTDSLGRYRFDTIRPASYPSRTAPAHVHMHVIEPGCCTYWIDSVHFTDDPLLDAGETAGERRERGGSGIVDPIRDADGVWRVQRDIELGKDIPGYPDRGG